MDNNLEFENKGILNRLETLKEMEKQLIVEIKKCVNHLPDENSARELHNHSSKLIEINFERNIVISLMN